MVSRYTCCSTAYNKFIADGDDFRIISGPEVIKESENTTLLVLDSSFNPPHWGHYNLVRMALEFYKTNPDCNKIQILLLLSVSNADKTPKPASFDKRMDMICLLADELQRELTKSVKHLDISVGITLYGKFVDKSTAIKKSFLKNGRIVYLVGFDTIVRIFDPKYYSPILPAVALKTFMETTEFFCLTRKYDENTKQQIQYSDDIGSGKYEPVIPKEWGNKVNILENTDKFSSISSSNVRLAFDVETVDVTDLEKVVPKTIILYIVNKSKEEGKSIFFN